MRTLPRIGCQGDDIGIQRLLSIKDDVFSDALPYRGHVIARACGGASSRRAVLRFLGIVKHHTIESYSDYYGMHITDLMMARISTSVLQWSSSLPPPAEAERRLAAQRLQRLRRAASPG